MPELRLCSQCLYYADSPNPLCDRNITQRNSGGEIMEVCNDHFTPRDFTPRNREVDVDLPCAMVRPTPPTLRGIRLPHEPSTIFHEDAMVDMPKKKVIKKKKPYKSQDGFELVPLHRGFTEIIPLWEIFNDVIRRHKADVFICGGYARWCASPKYEPAKAGDIDIYSETKKVYDRLLGRLIHDNNLKIKNENEMAITFEHPNSGVFYYMPPIQLIKPIKDGSIVAKGDKKTILSNFDFTIIRAAIESPDSVMVDKDFTHDETHNILRLKNIHHPLSSLLRCAKYIRHGYWLTPTEAAKLFENWDALKDENKTKLLKYISEIREGVIFDKENLSAFYDLWRGRII